MEPTENRYAHLLQPIRELTRNWEVDVASELNDYLEELDEMCISFDGGRTRLNFAEAALLIQGSTSIYSKKVELLHSLVFQTLEYINDKNKKRSKEAEAQQGAAGAAQADHDADDMFVPVELEACDTSQKMEHQTNVAVVPLPPKALVPPETHEKNKLPLLSLKGEVLCSQKDFWMNLFHPGPDHLILLMVPSAAATLPPDQDLCPAGSPRSAGPASTFDPDVAESFFPVGEDMEEEVSSEEQTERQQARSEGRRIQERRDEEPQQQQERTPVTTWMLHDPYASGREVRAFRTGRCYQVPDGLDDGGKRKRKHAAPLQDFRSWFRRAFDPPEPKLKAGPTFPELNYVYLSIVKERLKRQRRICRRAGVVVTEEELRKTFLQPEEVGPEDGLAHAELLGGEDDGSDGYPDDVPADVPADLGLVSPGAQREELTYEELVKLRVEQLVMHSRGYTQETALSRRVKDWEDKIRPELALQEERPPFDIHQYGEQIVDELSAVGCRRTFASIVQGLDNFEACKYLLASLQLANDYAVQISTSGGLEDSVDTMTLTLLSTLRATDRFKTLAASSSPLTPPLNNPLV